LALYRFLRPNPSLFPTPYSLSTSCSYTQTPPLTCPRGGASQRGRLGAYSIGKLLSQEIQHGNRGCPWISKRKWLHNSPYEGLRTGRGSIGSLLWGADSKLALREYPMMRSEKIVRRASGMSRAGLRVSRPANTDPNSLAYKYF
jgi:hypothetical protein